MTCITLGDKDPRGPDHGKRALVERSKGVVDEEGLRTSGRVRPAEDLLMFHEALARIQEIVRGLGALWPLRVIVVLNEEQAKEIQKEPEIAREVIRASIHAEGAPTDLPGHRLVAVVGGIEVLVRRRDR
jgi:hypothetical protein